MRNNFKRYIKRVKKITTPLLFLSLIGTLNKSTLADDIDTSSSITNTAIQNWGYSDTLTYGQWFTAPEGKTEVDSFSFFIIPANNGANADLLYKGYLYQFDQTNKKVVGSEIFSSEQKTIDFSALNNTSNEIFIDVSGGSITSGETYVLFLSAYGQGNSDGAYFKWFADNTSADGLSASSLVYLNTNDPTSTSSTWRSIGSYDFIYKLIWGSGSTPFHSEWVQPYAAMQTIGLASIKNNRDLVLSKAGECNNYGWVIGDTDYCVYTNANNTTASVNGNSIYGGYDYAKFNTSLNIEKTINNRWKAGFAYGVGSSNLDNYNFSSTTANLSSTNTHYSIYGVNKVSDKFTLKGMIGGSDFDYKGNRNYSTTSATSAYDTDGYTAEINGTWDIKKNIKNMKTPIRLQPSVGVAYAAHTQDGFSESGSGDLITLESNQSESLLLKTGISVDKQIPMEGGKWLLVPSIALNYEMDTYADDNHRGLKGGVTGSSDATTLVSAKTFGQHNGSVKVGADFVCTKDFMFNLNAEYGLAEGGDELSYGGGFRWQF